MSSKHIYNISKIFPSNTCSFIESITNLSPNTKYDFNATDLVLLEFKTDKSGSYKFSTTDSSGNQLPGFPISDMNYDLLLLSTMPGKYFLKHPKINLVQNSSYREGCITDKDCDGSYCMNYTPHQKPYTCNSGQPHNCPTTFNSDGITYKILGGAIGIQNLTGSEPFNDSEVGVV